MNDHLVSEFPPEVQAILTIMNDEGVAFNLHVFKTPAHRASQAADLLGCSIGAVVKSLVFQTRTTGMMVLVLVSGDNRADPQRLQQIYLEPVHPANPADVLEISGYPVGSVPPFGLAGEFPVVIDADLMNYPQVWAAAGSAHVLFGISPSDLIHLSGSQIVEIKLI
jgi:prolyl-tRNA editing enzyme YbaK/EbsC (Cys-tRNA(Pro) deacylase)